MKRIARVVLLVLLYQMIRQSVTQKYIFPQMIVWVEIITAIKRETCRQRLAVRNYENTLNFNRPDFRNTQNPVGCRLRSGVTHLEHRVKPVLISNIREIR